MALEQYIEQIIPFVKGKFSKNCQHIVGKSHRIYGFVITGETEIGILYAQCEICGAMLETTGIEQALKK